MEYQGAMKNYPQVMSEVKKIPGVVASTPFIYSQAMLKSENSVSGAVLRGISLKDAFGVLDLGRMQAGSVQALAEPQRRESATGATDVAPGILIGKELAKNLGLILHDPVYIITPMGISTPMGFVPRMKKFVVVGIFDSGFYEYDSTLAYVSLKDSQAFLNLGDTVSGLEIKVDDIYRADAIARNIEKKLGFPYWARHWMEMNKNLFSALKLEKRVMFIILSLIVLVAAFNIISTLIMVVMEKNKDIAILKSMGATSGSIMKIFVFQGLTIGMIGTTLGTLAGLVLSYNLSRLSAFIEQLFGFKILPGDVYYLNQLPSRVDYTDVAIIVVGSILISFLSTLYPSRRAARLDPAEALRNE
ncbi:MAG: Lipoprotein-releasing system transmembrane protein LolE [Syntrophus sp. PtaU1.Bin208]|nr:MAG: Lipoprotein-releasing system transmembrane protein LolE [Syntrophus sp. PtaU1.Bin208]